MEPCTITFLAILGMEREPCQVALVGSPDSPKYLTYQLGSASWLSMYLIIGASEIFMCTCTVFESIIFISS